MTRLRERLPAHSAAHAGARRLPARQHARRLSPDGTPEILAVVDWEMSTLGDPLADLGLTLTYWRTRRRRAGPRSRSPADVDRRARLPELPRVRRRTTPRSPAPTSADLDFYVAFGNFKLAVIVEGIHARFQQGKTVGEGFENIGAAVPTLIERAHRVLEG